MPENESFLAEIVNIKKERYFLYFSVVGLYKSCNVLISSEAKIKAYMIQYDLGH